MMGEILYAWWERGLWFRGFYMVGGEMKKECLGRRLPLNALGLTALKQTFIIPLKTILEKIKGCRRPDIFRIRQWVRQIHIISGNDHAFNVDARIFPCFFPLRYTLYPATTMHLMLMHPFIPVCLAPHALYHLSTYPCNRDVFVPVVFACLCVYFQRIL